MLIERPTLKNAGGTAFPAVRADIQADVDRHASGKDAPSGEPVLLVDMLILSIREQDATGEHGTHQTGQPSAVPIIGGPFLKFSNQPKVRNVGLLSNGTKRDAEGKEECGVFHATNLPAFKLSQQYPQVVNPHG